ncbi:MAG: arginine repressor [Lachnospiraceae bacterium]|nr:arginine repressor [Lachnospiraceae bacterium]
MKQKRHQCILKLIKDYEIDTQEELVERLKDKGFHATQATISRDIRQLGLTKQSLGKGRQKYVSIHQGNAFPTEKFSGILKEGILSMEPAQNLLVIKTVSGMAMAVAAAVDACHFPEIVGSIAGDDTIMVACKGSREAELVQTIIEDMLKEFKV